VTISAPPHGGRLVDLLAPPARAAELSQRASRLPSWRLTRRQTCDLELLACGGFSPLESFLGRDDYLAVCESMRLADGTLWPVPVALDVPDEVAAAAGSAGALALRGPGRALLAVLRLTESWVPDLHTEAMAVFGTTDPRHPGVAYLLRHTHRRYVTGVLEALRLPEHRDFRPLRHTPAQLRAEFAQRGWSRVVAFQTRNPMHRAHQELTLRAALKSDANLLVHPVVGVTKPGDVEPRTRVRCYQAIMPSYPDGHAMLSLLPLAMRMAGPREALWHAIIRGNYGASHFIVGRDHAGPGTAASGRPFYGPYDAQELLRRHAPELGVQPVQFRQLVYVEEADAYLPEDEVPPGARVRSISGTQLRRWLAEGRELPEWFSAPEVAAELRRGYRGWPASAGERSRTVSLADTQP
jgi:sulfate adenylyltransferase